MTRECLTCWLSLSEQLFLHVRNVKWIHKRQTNSESAAWDWCLHRPPGFCRAPTAQSREGGSYIHCSPLCLWEMKRNNSKRYRKLCILGDIMQPEVQSWKRRTRLIMSCNKRDMYREQSQVRKYREGLRMGVKEKNRRGESVCGGVKVMRACRGKRKSKMGEKSRWYFISLHRMASHYHQI